MNKCFHELPFRQLFALNRLVVKRDATPLRHPFFIHLISMNRSAVIFINEYFTTNSCSDLVKPRQSIFFLFYILLAGSSIQLNCLLPIYNASNRSRKHENDNGFAENHKKRHWKKPMPSYNCKMRYYSNCLNVFLMI